MYNDDVKKQVIDKNVRRQAENVSIESMTDRQALLIESNPTQMSQYNCIIRYVSAAMA